jgi:hypothetical protein
VRSKPCSHCFCIRWYITLLVPNAYSFRGPSANPLSSPVYETSGRCTFPQPHQFLSQVLNFTTELPRMKLFFVLLALAALVLTCPPIFNHFYFLGNDTHTTADLVRDTLNIQPQLGWSEIVTMVGFLVSSSECL